MATPQQRRQFEKQKRDLTRKAQELNRQEEKIRQANLVLERERRALESEKREWKNKRGKMREELSVRPSPRASPAASPRRGGETPMTQRKMQKLQEELDSLKREMGQKNQAIRSLRVENKNLLRDLRVLQKQLSGKSGKTQFVDARISKAQMRRLKRELKIATRKIHKLLNSIRVRKRYYGKHINKFKKGENRYIRERAAKLKRDRVLTKYVFADRVRRVKLSRGKRDRVTLVTEDGEVVLRPVEVVVTPEEGVGDIDDPEEILRQLDDLDLDEDDMDEPLEDEDDDDDEDEDDEDAVVDDAELEAELQEMLNDPEYANENGGNDDDDGVYGQDNFHFPDDADGDSGDGKETESDEVKSPAPDTLNTIALTDDISNESQHGPYQVGDHVLLKDHAGIIRFIGPTPRSRGVNMFGIELIDGMVGKHNGTVGGVQYFECPEKRGMFVREEGIRRRMRPRDREIVDARNADRAQNETRRHSGAGRSQSGKPNLMTFVIEESSRRAKDIDKLRELLDEKDAESQNQGFGALMTAYQQRHAEFINGLDSLPSQPDEEEFEDVRTYNSSFMNFVALLGNTVGGHALLAANSKRTIEYFLDELTARIGDVHRLQDIHFDLDNNPDDRSKEERCQVLLDEIVSRHQSEEDDLNESMADNAPDVLEDFRSNNENWRGAVMRTKRNQDQLELLIADFAARTQAIAADIGGWKPLWQPPQPSDQHGDDGGLVLENYEEIQVGSDDDLDAPPDDDSQDDE